MSVTIDLLEQQLDRIEEIQVELEHVLRDDSLTSLEALVAEKEARLRTVLPDTADTDLEPYAQIVARLEAIHDADRKLMLLLSQKLSITRNQLRRIHDAIIATEGYAVEPAKTTARLRHGTDLTG